jgi:pimeloyl-ACP methyl ester carboxylesterase
MYSDLIPNSQFEVIDAAGHHPELEQPDKFVERITSFLERT